MNFRGFWASLSMLTFAIIGIGHFPAQAVPVLDIQGGQLVGARDVDVGGQLFDVTFEDGTCIDVFDGCDSNSDFLFDEADAILASNALLDQVFLNSLFPNIDSTPNLTFGCSADNCATFTPFAIADPFLVLVSSAFNDDADFNETDFQQLDMVERDRDLGSANATDIRRVYAVWSDPNATMDPPTDVPEPATLTLFGRA